MLAVIIIFIFIASFLIKPYRLKISHFHYVLTFIIIFRFLFFIFYIFNSNKSKVTIQQQKESNNINVSLMQLWRCLQGIKKKSAESSIPYRESKLTHLLMPALILTGLGCVAMVACVSPHVDDYDETLSILGRNKSIFSLFLLTEG